MYAGLVARVLDNHRIENRERLLDTLRSFGLVANANYALWNGWVEISQGNRLHFVLMDPADVLEATMLFRAFLRMHTLPAKKPLWDARVGIGLGNIEFEGSALGESSGPVFTLAYRALSVAEKRGIGWKLLSENGQWNSELEVSMNLANHLVEQWTVKSAEAVYYKLTMGKTQEQIAREIGISQPSVNSRLRQAGFDALEQLNSRFRSLVNSD